MDVVRLLPDSVANQIAAGEVIQRPASCLKELVENSLDAQATHVRVLVRDAGRTLLQVTDDGVGMSDTDARMAFERHATSKIREAKDLFTLRTMGFRGEALPSIAAVAQVEMTTRRREDDMGTRILIAGSDVESVEPCSCAVGTTFKVKNLFFNVPVRRKFLKTDQTELRNLLQEFYRIVLVNPKVAFTFVHNDEVLLELPATTEKQRIESIFGHGTARSYTTGLVDVRTDTELVSIRGFVSKPESTGKSSQQYFFVNGRYMRHPYFQKAVQTAYAGMLPGDYQPSFFLYFDISPDAIDVNIHPTKTEIKFADEQTVFQILLAAVREALGKFTLAPTIDFEREGAIEMPTPGKTPVAMPHVTFDPNYNPFHTRTAPASSYTPKVNQEWETLYAATTVESKQPLIPSLEEEVAGIPDVANSPVWYYGQRYILLPVTGGMLFVNAHRAHVCVLHKEFMEQLEKAPAAAQQLLFPETWDVAPDVVPMLEEILPDLRAIGFELDRLDRTCYTVSGVPSSLSSSSPIPTLTRMLQAVLTLGSSAREQWRHLLADTLAEDAAIRAGQPMTDEAMRDLLQRLFALPSYRRTPTGRQVVYLLRDDELQKQFL